MLNFAAILVIEHDGRSCRWALWTHAHTATHA